MKIDPLDERSMIRLQIRALKHGRSVEDEARELLNAALSDAEPVPKNLVARLRRKLKTMSNAPVPTPAGKSSRPVAPKTRGTK